jgi:hypothetical protein
MSSRAGPVYHAENRRQASALSPNLMHSGVGGGTAGPAHAAGAPAGVLPVGIVAAARFLFTTATGRNFLLASSSLKPGTWAMHALIARINGRVPNAAARAVTSRQAVSGEPAAGANQ